MRTFESRNVSITLSDVAGAALPDLFQNLLIALEKVYARGVDLRPQLPQTAARSWPGGLDKSFIPGIVWGQ